MHTPALQRWEQRVNLAPSLTGRRGRPARAKCVDEGEGGAGGGEGGGEEEELEVALSKQVSFAGEAKDHGDGSENGGGGDREGEAGSEEKGAVVETSGATGEQQQQERDRLLSQTKSGKGGAKWKHWRNTEGTKGVSRLVSMPTQDSATPKTLIDMTRLYSKTQNRSIQKKASIQKRASTKLRLQSLEAGEDWRRLFSTQMNVRSPAKGTGTGNGNGNASISPDSSPSSPPSNARNTKHGTGNDTKE